ncbi:MAG: hypothetical protein GEV03_11690 [Streptosporangiales bacterium]|nr:hypothetical protein [Streptosporangiales bacterium]
MSGSIFVAVVAAAAAAVGFALTGMLQHRAAARAPLRPALDPTLLYQLARQPLWLISIGAALTAFALQAAALRFGPLVLVQPILAMQVLVAPLLVAAVYHRRLDRELMLGAVLCLVGLSAFLIAAAPGDTAGSEAATRPSNPVLLPLVVLLFVTFLRVALGLSHASRVRGWSRALVLALGSGVLYGVTAGLLKATVDHADQGWTAPLGTWTSYALLVAGPAGFLLSQNAFQAGSFVAPLAVITVTDPLVGIGIGLLWLNERINAHPWAILAELVGLAVMALGIVVLARRLSRTPAAARADRAPSAKVGAPAAQAEPRPSCAWPYTGSKTCSGRGQVQHQCRHGQREEPVRQAELR